MPTKTEKLLSHRKRRSGILVPLIEDFLLKPVRVETYSDIAFVKELLEKQMLREKRRVDANVYSPSSLAECIRRVYLKRTSKVKPVDQLRSEINYYFTTGEWSHFKWQYILYKMDEAKVLKLHGVEIDVMSKHGDIAGTIDAVVEIDKVIYPVDFKGVNVRSFNVDPPIKYCVQLAGYIMLLNVDPRIKVRAETGLLVFENKGGPDNRHPVALREIEIKFTEWKHELWSRMEVLRKHEAQNTIPPPECTSTKETQFQSCQFRKFCRQEVKEIEENATRSDTSKFKVRVPEKRGADSA